MKKVVKKRTKLNSILLTLAAVLFIVFILLPLSLSIFDGSKIGNVALIPINGMVTSNGGKYLGSSTTSSQVIVDFIKEAEANSKVKAILLEINVNGGSPVATDEVVLAIKKAEKPVVAVIREIGASGGYWIASAADHVIANRMSTTGSIGVFASYLEFSGLMDKYGVGYERINSGEYKDLGVPFRKLEEEEKSLLQKRADKFHDFFIQGVAENRNLPESKVRELATGEVYMGVEALNHGLVDQLGNRDTAEQYLKDIYELEEIDYVTYLREFTLMELISGSFADFSYKVGEGLGSMLIKQENNIILI